MDVPAPIRAVFGGLSRQGPGSAASTRKALSLLPSPLPDGLVVDAGCGTGSSTLVLAEALRRPVLATDVDGDSLAVLRERAAAAGLGELVETKAASMDALGLPPESVALMWSEGAVFTVGAEAALAHWWPLLKPGGVVAFSDLAWVGPERPAEAVALFDDCYDGLAGMPDVAGLMALANRLGYRQEAHFVLPESDWWDEYFAGLGERVAALRPTADADVAAILDRCDQEMAVHRRHAGPFGYVFLVLVKAGRTVPADET